MTLLVKAWSQESRRVDHMSREGALVPIRLTTAAAPRLVDFVLSLLRALRA